MSARPAARSRLAGNDVDDDNTSIILRGAVIAKDGMVSGRPGYGKYVADVSQP